MTALFSEGIDINTLTSSTFVLLDPAQTPIAADITYNSGTYTATLNPTFALADSTTYTARIVSGASGVKDPAGNALAADYVWTFTTAVQDITAPTVVAVSPVNLAIGVNKSVNVTVRFSEAMAAGTINPCQFRAAR